MNLKKHISVLLTFFLLVSNLGLAFNVHYCDDKIASVSLSMVPASDKIDECCGVVEKGSSCCNDKIIKAEIKSDQITVNILSVDANYVPVTDYWEPFFGIQNIHFKQQDKIAYNCDANAPPLYVLYSQYTLYS